MLISLTCMPGTICQRRRLREGEAGALGGETGAKSELGGNGGYAVHRDGDRPTALDDPSRPWGERLRLWREEFKSWSRDEFVEEVAAIAFKTKEGRGDKLDISRVKRWESGRTQRPQAIYRRILAQMGAPLPGPPAYCAPRTPPERPQGSSDFLPSLPETGEQQQLDVGEVINRVTRKDLAMNRRDLGKLFAGMFVGSALLEQIERLLATPIAQASTSRVPSIGYEELARIEQTASLFRGWDDQFGGGLRRKAVVGQLNEVSELLDGPHPPEITRRLHGAMAELSETVATMSWDSGQGSAAQGYYLMALQAARAAEDPTFAANVMAGMARQLLYLDRPNEALELVRLAQDNSAGRATPAVKSMLYTREAWAYSKLGRVGAFRRATANAEDTFASVSLVDEPHWIRYFNAAELHGTIGGRLLEMAHHDRRHADAAAELIERAIEARPGGRFRSSALDEIGLAQTFLIREELEEAVRRGHAAIDTASQTSSDRVHSQLLELYGQTGRHAQVRAVAELRDRLKPMVVQGQTLES